RMPAISPPSMAPTKAASDSQNRRESIISPAGYLSRLDGDWERTFAAGSERFGADGCGTTRHGSALSSAPIASAGRPHEQQPSRLFVQLGECLSALCRQGG